MKRRRSILLDPELDRKVERRARERGTTYTEVVREALEKQLDEGDENPNQWLIDSIGVVHSGGKFPPIDSEEGRELLRRHMESRRSGGSS
ncbi:MAG: ribbon-helix-helix protein, CopG family [Tepidiformaceae bacterium]